MDILIKGMDEIPEDGAVLVVKHDNGKAYIKHACTYGYSMELVKLPAVQLEREHGKWIYGEHDVSMCDGYRCDKCGFFVSWDYQHKSIDFINDYHFCPSCGADMRGEE